MFCGVSDFSNSNLECKQCKQKTATKSCKISEIKILTNSEIAVLNNPTQTCKYIFRGIQISMNSNIASPATFTNSDTRLTVFTNPVLLFLDISFILVETERKLSVCNMRPKKTFNKA